MIGALVIDKPAGWTSHDVVAKVRRLAATRRVGHTGTLDPFATGVLVLCIGQATRLAQFVSGAEKEYLAAMRLGWATDTQDLTGERIGDHAASEQIPDDAALIRRVLAEFSGEQEQLPPMYSAKKVAGRALYKHARAGREIDRNPVRIRAELEFVNAPIEPDGRMERDGDGTVVVHFRVTCSAGTYVRTLANDIGERLGCGAHLCSLRRTRVGSFVVSESVTLDALEGHVAERLIRPAAIVAGLAVQHIGDNDAKLVRTGMPISPSFGDQVVAANSDVALRLPGSELIAIARYDADAGVLRPRIVLGDPGEQ